MNSRFNPAEIVRSLTGAVAAVILGTTLIAAAAVPAVTGPVTGNVTAAAESNIVARA